MTDRGDRIRVIFNPVSGRSVARGVLGCILDRLRGEGLVVSLERTTGPGHARVLGRQCRDGGYRAVVVVGGDGTVNEVVDGMSGSTVPILVVPGGTENILAKYLGIVSDPDWLWNVLDAGRQLRFDVGVMNGRRFLLVSGIGFDAEVVRRLSIGRRGHISHLDYFWPIWRTFWGYRHPRLRVEADGESLGEGPSLVFVGNVPRYAAGLAILDRALPDDGLLDVCVFRCSGQLPLIRHAFDVLRRRQRDGLRVVYRQARHVRVESDGPVGIQLDGDWAGRLPAEYTIEEGAARFLVHRDWPSGAARNRPWPRGTAS